MTCHHIDRNPRHELPFRIKPDLIAYAKDNQPNKITDSRAAELIIEFKWAATDDAFRDVYDKGDGTQSFVHDIHSGYDTLGQLTAYAVAQLGAQYRTHMYSIFIVKDMARVLRWDRSGAIVTAAFNYNETSYLAEFLYRYGRASPEARGVDTSVSPPSLEVDVDARRGLQLDDKAELLNLAVPHLTGTRNFVVQSPSATAYTPPGRATRGSRAWDVEEKKLVYLKDSWRVDLPEFESEGLTYQKLEENNVPNVAKCIVAGDIGDSAYHATKTQNYVSRDWACDTGSSLTPHRHYRLILDIVGRPLTRFESTREMVQAVRDALIGTWSTIYPTPTNTIISSSRCICRRSPSPRY